MGGIGVFRDADGFKSIGTVSVVPPPCQLSLSERQDRGANKLDLGLHFFTAPVVAEQDHDMVSDVNQLFASASVCSPRLEPVEPVLAEALQTRVRPGHSSCHDTLEVVRNE